MKLSLPRLPTLPKPPPSVVARLVVLAGVAVLSVGVGLIFVPAGVIAAGVALVAGGLLLIDTDGQR